MFQTSVLVPCGIYDLFAARSLETSLEALERISATRFGIEVWDDADAAMHVPATKAARR